MTGRSTFSVFSVVALLGACSVGVVGSDEEDSGEEDTAGFTEFETDDSGANPSEVSSPFAPEQPAERPGGSESGQGEGPAPTTEPMPDDDPEDPGMPEPELTPSPQESAEPTPTSPVPSEPGEEQMPPEPEPEPEGEPVELPSAGSGASGSFVVNSMLLSPGQPDGGQRLGNRALRPVASDPFGERAVVGFNDSSTPPAAVVTVSDGTTVRIEDAAVGGVTFTADGFAVLLFDPNPEVVERTWAAVERFDDGGQSLFRTELFHSDNLEDEGTKGAPETSRLDYLSATDELVAYFGHTMRWDDGVRHQGGYLSRVNASGEQAVLNDWFGSHNLDQRLVSDGERAFVLGLGDAYPEGIFFAEATGRPEPRVIQPLASAGNGATNGQLGGIVDQGSSLLIPFVTNSSVPPDLDAGTWPDIDEEIASQIRDAAATGTDIGLMMLDKGQLPNMDSTLDVAWLDFDLSEGATVERLKAARFGNTGETLLAWAETTGGGFNPTRTFFAVVLDADLSPLGPAVEVPEGLGFSAGDDLVATASGNVLWAAAQADGVHLVTLSPVP